MTVVMTRDEYDALKLDCFERDKILDLLFESVEADWYINPHTIMTYLKTCYPNRYEKRMAELAQRDKAHGDNA